MRHCANPPPVKGNSNDNSRLILTGLAALPVSMSFNATAAALAISPRTFRNWLRAGKGPVPVRLGGRHMVFLADDVEAFLRAHRGVGGEG